MLTSREAKVKTKEEAIIILNHKKVLDYINENPSYYQIVTFRKVE